MMELLVRKSMFCLRACDPSNKFDRSQEILQKILFLHENLVFDQKFAKILASRMYSVTRCLKGN